MYFNSLRTRRAIERSTLLAFLFFAIVWSCPVQASVATGNTADPQQAKPRARELGVAPGVLNPGPLNAITDVSGVLVSHVTLIEGTDVRTGVTAILPHGGNLYQEKVPAGFAVANGYGKFAGTTQILELGEIETPIVLTNTLSVPQGMEGIIKWTLDNRTVKTILCVIIEIFTENSA